MAGRGSEVSHHLRVLREAGLVRSRVDAQRRIYSVAPVGLDALWAYVTTSDGLRRWLADGQIGPDRARLRFVGNGPAPALPHAGRRVTAPAAV